MTQLAAIRLPVHSTLVPAESKEICATKGAAETVVVLPPAMSLLNVPSPTGAGASLPGTPWAGIARAGFSVAGFSPATAAWAGGEQRTGASSAAPAAAAASIFAIFNVGLLDIGGERSECEGTWSDKICHIHCGTCHRRPGRDRRMAWGRCGHYPEGLAEITV